ncbi:MAG: hypothetical protein AAF682_16305 [Planctomycetota bacterium]
MLKSLLLPLLLLPALTLGDDFSDRRKAAGDDVDKLWDLALWCQANEHEDDARSTFERILKLAPEHEGAHEKLRHHRYDERWFETYRELSKYRRAEEERMAAKGLVRHGQDWVAAADVPFVRMGWVQEDKAWISPAAVQRREADAKYTAEGWQQQDLTWIHPDDFEPWRAGLWKCGEEWLDTDAANAWHAELGRWWQRPGERFIALSTADREATDWASWWADQTYADLARAIGVQPDGKPEVVVLRSLDQYNEFAAGSTEGQRPPAEGSGWSSVHYAFHADSYVDFSGGAPEYRGLGVCYYAADDETLKPWGQHAVRHAAAQSYIEEVDPSWDTVSQMLQQQPGTPVNTQSFWGEKKLPTWFRFGVASYCERYFRDANVGEDGDPWWARAWTLQNLRDGGGLRDLEAIFAFQIDANDPDGSGRMITEAGLLVSFVLDGECAPVIEAHQALKHALATGGDHEAAGAELKKALLKNEKKLRLYANL